MSSHDEFRKQAQRDHAAKLKHHAGGGAVMKGEKAMIERAMAQHESHDHPGKSKTKLKLATGGVAEDRAPARLDRARGGKAKSGHAKTNVNVIVAPGHGGQPMPIPVPIGAGPGGPPPMMPPPGGPPPGMGGPPPGMGAMPPRPMPGPPVGAGVPGMGMRARGGRAGFKAGGAVGDMENKPATGDGDGDRDGGAGGGLGRLDKIADYGKMSDKVERKRGGRTGRADGGAADEDPLKTMNAPKSPMPAPFPDEAKTMTAKRGGRTGR